MTRTIAYCRDYGWFVSGDEHGSRDRTRRTLNHTVETGHDVDSLRTELSTERALSAFFD